MGKLIVYKITNTINNKVYIGITKVELKKRWIQHKCNSTRKQYHLYRAIIKYGIDKFNIEVVAFCNTEKEMYLLEIELINKYKSDNSQFGYNNSTGGESSTLGSKRTLEQRKKISDYQKVRKRQPHSPITILKMKASAKGRNTSKAVLSSILKRKGKPAHNKIKIVSISANGFKTEYESLTVASVKTGILVASICNNLKNKTKTAGGLTWEYQQKN